MSNEMDEEDLRSCLITTVINNKDFQELHGVVLGKPEKEIVLGVYHDRKGEIIRRKIDDFGIYIESNEDYIKRVQSESDEYWQVRKVTEWIDSLDRKARCVFKDVAWLIIVLNKLNLNCVKQRWFRISNTLGMTL